VGLFDVGCLWIAVLASAVIGGFVAMLAAGPPWLAAWSIVVAYVTWPAVWLVVKPIVTAPGNLLILAPRWARSSLILSYSASTQPEGGCTLYKPEWPAGSRRLSRSASGLQRD
jgi:hypothetical protein